MMDMVDRHDDDKRIAAASLLELVDSASNPSHRYKADGIDEGKGQECRKELKPEYQSSEKDNKTHVRVSEDEDSYQTRSSHNSFSASSTRDNDQRSTSRFCEVASDVMTTQQEQILEVLMKLLTSREYLETMYFLSDGNQFVITNTKKFSDEIMQGYFKMNDFGFFVNKLNRWGFTHAVLENDQHLFYHPLFMENDWVSLCHIRNTQIGSEQERIRSLARITNKRKLKQSLVLDESESQLKVQKRLSNESIHGCILSTDNNQLENIRQTTASKRIYNDQTSVSPSSICDSANLFIPTDHTFVGMSTVEIENVTKHVVTKAIDCLLHDEGHTLELIAQRGHELHSRRLSLTGTSSIFGQANHGSVVGNFLQNYIP